MAATDFNAGSLILVKEVPPSALKEGDIITFMSQDTDSFGETMMLSAGIFLSVALTP